MLILFHWLAKGHNQTVITKRLAEAEASAKVRGTPGAEECLDHPRSAGNQQHGWAETQGQMLWLGDTGGQGLQIYF